MDGPHSVRRHCHPIAPDCKGEARHISSKPICQFAHDGLCNINIDIGIGIVKWLLFSHSPSLVFPIGWGLIGSNSLGVTHTVQKEGPSEGDSVLSTQACGAHWRRPADDPQNPQAVPCNSESPPILNHSH